MIAIDTITILGAVWLSPVIAKYYGGTLNIVVGMLWFLLYGVQHLSG